MRRNRTDRAIVALLLLLAAAGIGLALYARTLSPTPGTPSDDAHPRQWWACQEQMFDDLTTPPACLSRETP